MEPHPEPDSLTGRRRGHATPAPGALQTSPPADAGGDFPGALDGPAPASAQAARVGLYVHVPFCAVRCRYCDFSSGALSARALERYLEGMEREVALRAPAAAGVAFTSVFFGGGTPSALSARHFARLMGLLRAHFTIAGDAEITLEANPESVRASLLAAWRAGGVDRLSFGVQSFHADELARLGRIHDAARPAAAVKLARAHGFERLSLDLMFGFPGHSEARFAATVERALALEPEHLSAYCFIAEAGTPMGDEVLNGRTEPCDPDRQTDLYHGLATRLARAGYGCYETSNFCRPGAEARHNLVYWLRRDYLGLGPSAHGLWRGVRYGNHYATERWAASLEQGLPCDTHEPETEHSRADELVMLGLRLGRGVRAADHAPGAWRELVARYRHPFAAGLAAGRLAGSADGVWIRPRDRFVADDIIAWLMALAERGDPAARQAAGRRVAVDSRAIASVT